MTEAATPRGLFRGSRRRRPAFTSPPLYRFRDHAPGLRDGSIENRAFYIFIFHTLA